MKSNKKFILIGAIIIIVVVIYIITTIAKKNKSKEPKTGDTLKDDGRIINQTASNGAVNTTVFPIKRGSQGQHVLYLQQALNIVANKRDYIFKINNVSKSKIGEDSSFGIETETALKQLYGIVEVSKFMAKQIAKDTGNSSFVLIINQIQ